MNRTLVLRVMSASLAPVLLSACASGEVAIPVSLERPIFRQPVVSATEQGGERVFRSAAVAMLMRDTVRAPQAVSDTEKEVRRLAGRKSSVRVSLADGTFRVRGTKQVQDKVESYLRGQDVSLLTRVSTQVTVAFLVAPDTLSTEMALRSALGVDYGRFNQHVTMMAKSSNNMGILQQFRNMGHLYVLGTTAVPTPEGTSSTVGMTVANSPYAASLVQDPAHTGTSINMRGRLQRDGTVRLGVTDKVSFEGRTSSYSSTLALAPDYSMVLVSEGPKLGVPAENTSKNVVETPLRQRQLMLSIASPSVVHIQPE